MKRWQRLASTPLLDDRWMKLRADRCQLASGVVLDPYYVMEEAEWVHVVPVLNDGRLLLVQQYRYAADVLC
ncbi:MAG TPA: NUDIX hydrolase, partial [Casimicrobium huifangae]|nr:NUDIX hydrolase [Casimicrobium huifangae]